MNELFESQLFESQLRVNGLYFDKRVKYSFDSFVSKRRLKQFTTMLVFLKKEIKS